MINTKQKRNEHLIFDKKKKKSFFFMQIAY